MRWINSSSRHIQGAALVLTISLLIMLGIQQSYAQSEWTWLNPVSPGGGLAHIAGDGNTFVAVGYYGAILRSTDGGATWHPIAGATTNALLGVAASGTTYVAVGVYGTIVRSNDSGLTWNVQSSGTSSYLYGVAGSGNTFVAVGADGIILQSTDGGIHWHGQASGASSTLYGVAGAGSTFVAVGDAGTILRSTDGGLTWSDHSTDAEFYLNSVAGNGNTFIVVGHLTILRSTDGGMTWTGTQTPSDLYNLDGVAGDGTTFVAIGGAGLSPTLPPIIARSTDGGLTWNHSPSDSYGHLYSIAGDGTTFVAIGEDATVGSDLIVRSTDSGATWSSRTSVTVDPLSGVVGDENTFVAVSVYGNIVRSTDGGVHWNRQFSTNTFNDNFQDVAGTSSALITVGIRGVLFRSTDDGVTWHSQSSATTNDLYGVAGAGTTFVAVGDFGTIVRSTDGGYTWDSQTSGTTNNLTGVIGDGNIFVAVGSGCILRSSDGGITWSAQNTAPYSYQDVAGDGSTFVAVGGHIMRSTDGGVTWDDVDNGTYYNLEGVTQNGNTFVAVGLDLIVRSTDGGLTWSDESSNLVISKGLYDVAYANGTFVAVGHSGAILRNESGSSVTPTPTTSPTATPTPTVTNTPTGPTPTFTATPTLTPTSSVSGLAVILPNDAAGTPGDQVTIPIVVPNAVDGVGIFSYEFVLSFDPTVLSIATVDFIGTLSNGWNATVNTGTAGEVQVVAFSTNPLSGSGTLANLIFDVAGAQGATTALTWTSFQFNEGEPVAQVIDGFFTVRSAWTVAGQVYYQDDAVEAMSGVTVDLSGTSTVQTTTDSEGYVFEITATGAYEIVPTYSGTVNGISGFDAAFIAQCVAGLRPVSSCPLLASDASGNGSLSGFDAALIAQYVVGLNGPTSRVGTWVFDPASHSYASIDSDLLAEDFAAYLVGEVTGNWSSTNAAASTTEQVDQVTPPLTITTGQTDVTLKLSQASVDLLALQAIVRYDEHAARYVDILPTAELRDGWQLVANEVAPGTVMIIGYGTLPVQNGSELGTLYFETLDENRPLAPVITHVQLNEEPQWIGQTNPAYQQFLPFVTK